MSARFLTTNEAAAWLQEHYGMPIQPHTLRRLAKSGRMKVYRKNDDAWYRFTRETLAAYASSQGFEAVE